MKDEILPITCINSKPSDKDFNTDDSEIISSPISFRKKHTADCTTTDKTTSLSTETRDASLLFPTPVTSARTDARAEEKQHVVAAETADARNILHTGCRNLRWRQSGNRQRPRRRQRLGRGVRKDAKSNDLPQIWRASSTSRRPVGPLRQPRAFGTTRERERESEINTAEGWWLVALRRWAGAPTPPRGANATGRIDCRRRPVRPKTEPPRAPTPLATGFPSPGKQRRYPRFENTNVGRGGTTTRKTHTFFEIFV